jgi:uncharacterized cofD-like protein
MNKLRHRVQWLMPGLSVKRWVIMGALGTFCVLMGLALALNLHPVSASIKVVTHLAPHIPATTSGPLLVLLGVLMIYLGSKRVYRNISSAITPSGEEPNVLEALVRRHKLEHGPKVVAIGGGTGLSTLLRGLKHYTSNITAVVTVGDDGGSSGRLREEQGVIPPGDIRNCIAALADEEDLITSLFQYRFKTGSGLEGHSFGNLFLTALCQVTGDMMTAIKASAQVLNIKGKVLPSTLDQVTLVGHMEDGRIIRGESNIPNAAGKLAKLVCEPECPLPLPEALDAIREAQLIVLGPGSLYTSIISNLLIDPIAKAVSDSKAPKIYVANIMTQPGETDGFTVADHVQAILDHSPHPKLVDAVLVNSWIPQPLLQKYLAVNSPPVVVDKDRLQTMGIEVIMRPLIDEHETQTIRHDPRRTARAAIKWFKQDYVPQRVKLIAVNKTPAGTAVVETTAAVNI